MDKVFQIYDRAYGQMFSNRELFKQLVQSFVKEPWVKEVDFNNLERVNKSYISEEYQKSESDIIYKLNFQNNEMYIYLLLEFQSSVDKFMPVRCLNYITSFYLDQIKERGESIKLPPIFPIVLYSGDEKWNHSEQISDFIDNHDILGDYGIDFKICLIKENSFSMEELLQIGNIVSTLFLAEAHYDIDVIFHQVDKIMESEGITLQLKLFLNYFHQLSVNEKIDSIDYNIIKDMYKTKEEVHSMMLTAIRNEKEKIRQEGRKEGRQEGRQDGLQEGIQKGEQIGIQKGIRNNLKMLLAKKFKAISNDLESEIDNCTDIDILNQILDNIFELDSLDQVSKFFD